MARNQSCWLVVASRSEQIIDFEIWKRTAYTNVSDSKHRKPSFKLRRRERIECMSCTSVSFIMIRVAGLRRQSLGINDKRYIRLTPKIASKQTVIHNALDLTFIVYFPTLSRIKYVHFNMQSNSLAGICTYLHIHPSFCGLRGRVYRWNHQGTHLGTTETSLTDSHI